MSLTRKEAIDAIKGNYPPENYQILREALDLAIMVLEDDTVAKQRAEIERLSDAIESMRSEISYSLNSNKSEEVKQHYLENAVRIADRVN